MFKSRNKNIIYSALFSIFVGSLILNLSGKTLQEAGASGAFSLSEYNSLPSVKSIISCYDKENAYPWKKIVVQNIVVDNNYSSQNALSDYGLNDYHFIICNGNIGDNGQVISSENWKKQAAITSKRWNQFSRDVIRIGIITDDVLLSPTEAQIKRVNLLAGTLARKFDIPPMSIFTPFF